MGPLAYFDLHLPLKKNSKLKEDVDLNLQDMYPKGVYSYYTGWFIKNPIMSDFALPTCSRQYKFLSLGILGTYSENGFVSVIGHPNHLKQYGWMPKR